MNTITNQIMPNAPIEMKIMPGVFKLLIALSLLERLDKMTPNINMTVAIAKVDALFIAVLPYVKTKPVFQIPISAQSPVSKTLTHYME